MIPKENQPYVECLDAFLAESGIRYFSMRTDPNLCYIGKRIWRRGQVAELQPAPKALWPNLIPTLRILDWLRGELGVPLVVESGYRSEAYNRLVGGKPKSLHLMFNAIDFHARGRVSPTALARKLLEHPDARGTGIGLYEARGFVHLDTRGLRKLGHAPARWPREPRWWA